MLLKLQAAAVVNIGGLAGPTSVTFDADGRVYISELTGKIKVANSWSANSTSGTWVDLTTDVASVLTGAGNELGLTSIVVAGEYLYGVYAAYNAANAGKDCSGTQLAGQPAWNITGCPTAGRLSRWQIRANGTAGPQEILVDGLDKMCSQFWTLGADNVKVGPDGYLYVSTGGWQQSLQRLTGKHSDDTIRR